MSKILKLFILFSFLSVFSANLVAEQITPDAAHQAAAQGDAKAQAILGAMYLLGRNGVEKDEQKAAEWFLKSANQDFVEAEVIMAALYDRGIGVNSDRETATKWYEKAAAHGHGASMAILGKNAAAKGSVAFNYQAMRLSAAKRIPTEYSNSLLLSK